ncbi:MAG TPA: hypothetical protein VNO14_05815 [Blastocatellia bacterium]|nr:hypothetical protein [Blastocatellia bacterium]
MVAALLALLVPHLDSYILSRITEINVGGVKLVIAQAETIREQLKIEEIQPHSMLESDHPSDQPFPVAELKGFQRYEYEKLSYRLYQVFDQIKDPRALSPDLKVNYRELLRHVGKAAFAMKHYTKYLDIVLHLRQFPDEELSDEDMFLMGHAYLWAADEQIEASKKKNYWEKSIPFLRAAMKKNPDEVKYPFSLGVSLLSLGNYNGGIKLMETCMNINESITPWAKWNIACGLKKLGKDNKAMETLEEIPPGLWWQGIAKDDWFKDSKNSQFEASFKTLCERKIAEFSQTRP